MPRMILWSGFNPPLYEDDVIRETEAPGTDGMGAAFYTTNDLKESLPEIVDKLSIEALFDDAPVMVLKGINSLNAAQSWEVIAAWDDGGRSWDLLLTQQEGKILKAWNDNLTEPVRRVAFPDAYSDVPSFISDWLKARTVTIEDEAVDLIIQWYDENWPGMAKIMELLGSSYRGEVVDANTVRPLLKNNDEPIPFWHVTDAIMSGSAKDASKELSRAMDTGWEPYGALAMLSRTVAQWMRADGAGLSANDMMRTLRMPYGAAQRLYDFSRQVPSFTISECVRLASMADLDLKGKSGLSGDRVISMTVALMARSIAMGKKSLRMG